MVMLEISSATGIKHIHYNRNFFLMKQLNLEGNVRNIIQEMTPLTYTSAVDGKVLTLMCPRGSVINVVFSYIGSPDNGQCGSLLTPLVKRNCEGRQICSLVLDGNLIPIDPCYGVVKRTDVWHHCSHATNILIRKPVLFSNNLQFPLFL